MPAYLLALSPRDPGRTYVVDESRPVTVGRGGTNHIVVPDDPTVSRRHARISWTGAGYIVEDLGSARGTEVNGQLVYGPVELTHGDTLALGSTRFEFRTSLPQHLAPQLPSRRAPSSHMDAHVKVCGWLRIAFSSVWLLGAVLVIMLGAGIDSLVGDLVFLPLLTVAAGCFAITSLPGIFVGIGLLLWRPWARVGGIVLTLIADALNFPFGTALAIYMLWTLFHRDTVHLFERGGPDEGPK